MIVGHYLPSNGSGRTCGWPICQNSGVVVIYGAMEEKSRANAADGAVGLGMVGATRFELVTFCTPSKRATRLRYAPTTGEKRREL